MDHPEIMHHFLKTEMFEKNKSLKVYRISGQSRPGDVLHTHDYMQIWYVSKGQCEHWVGGIRHVMVSGEAFVLPPDISHKTVLRPEAEIIGCEFSLDTFLGAQDPKDRLFHSVKDSLLDLSFMLMFFPEDNAVAPKYAFSPASQMTVENLMLGILEEYEHDRLYSQEILQVEILHLLLLFAREYKSVSSEQASHDAYRKHMEAVKSSVRYIDTHYAEKLTLEDVCRRSMISKTYFCYLFKMLTGCTFVEYLVRLRIANAKELLKQPELSITQAAFEVGFNDCSHFTRTFKKIVGLSPRAYRTLHLKER